MRMIFDASQFSQDYRSQAWRAALCEIYVNLDTRLDDGTSYSGSVREARFGAVSITQSFASPQTISRRKHHLARENKDCYYLQLMQSGSSVVTQANRELHGHAASATLYYAGETYDLRYAGPSNCFYLEIPRNELAARLNIDTIPLCLNCTTGSGIGKVVAEFSVSLALESERLIGIDREKIADQLMNMVTCLVESSKDQKNQLAPARKVPLYVVKAFIEENLFDPLLDIDRIAKHHAVSVRYIQYLFKESGMTTIEWLWHRRLQLSHDLLTSARIPRKSLTEIALSVGFSSSSHFSNAFKAKFGLRPRDVRQAFLESESIASSVSI